MFKVKSLAIAAALALAASTGAVAQTNPPKGTPATNAAASGGSGSHQSAPKTGSAGNTQKVLHNQNGYKGMRNSHRTRHCHYVHRRGSRHLVRVCR